jgi:hypothetical protein
VDLHARQERYEANLNELTARVEDLEGKLEGMLEDKDVYLIVEELIKEKELIAKTELELFEESIEANVQENQVKLLKWTVATGLSSIATIAAIFGIFIN